MLDDPDDVRHVGRGEHSSFAEASVPGWQFNMEDDFLAHPELPYYCFDPAAQGSTPSTKMGDRGRVPTRGGASLLLPVAVVALQLLLRGAGGGVGVGGPAAAADAVACCAPRCTPRARLHCAHNTSLRLVVRGPPPPPPMALSLPPLLAKRQEHRTVCFYHTLFCLPFSRCRPLPLPLFLPFRLARVADGTAQGSRQQQQKQQQQGRCDLYAVFDGHGGAEVARFCKKRLAALLKASPEFREPGREGSDVPEVGW